MGGLIAERGHTVAIDTGQARDRRVPGHGEDALDHDVRRRERDLLLARLERRFPGSGPLVERYDAFRRQFVIPRDKLDAVFQKAIQAGRERTLTHVALPADDEGSETDAQDVAA